MTFGTGILFSFGALLVFLGIQIGTVWSWEVGACFVMAAMVLELSVANSVVAAWREHRLYSDMTDRRTRHGDATMATLKNVKAAGLTNNDPSSSIHLGAKDGKLISYAGSSHLLCVAPNNEGKTESVVIPNAVALTHNIVSTDKGGEVALATWKHRSDRLGHEIVVINPWKLHDELGLPAQRFNPVDRLVKLAATNDPDILDEARGYADLLLPQNPNLGDIAIFAEKGRQIIQWVLLHLAYEAAEFGSVCSLARLYDVLNGPITELEQLFEAMTRTPHRLSGQIARHGSGFAADAKRSPKSFGSYLNNAQVGLMLYSPAGHIGQSVSQSDFDPNTLKSGKMTIYIVAPPEQLTGSGGKWAGLVLYSLLRSMWGARKAEPRVTVLADEFANLSEGAIPLIPEVLKVGRSYGIQLFPFVQDLSTFERYGDEAPLFQSQMAVQQFWAVRNIKDASYLEERAGVAGIINESVNAGDDKENAKASFSATAVPLLRKHQVMQQGAFKQFIVYRAEPLIEADLVSYQQVRPWCDQVEHQSGTRLSVKYDVRKNGRK